MDMLNELSLGFHTALLPLNLLCLLVGCALGLLAGALTGRGLVFVMALLLPLLLRLPVSAMLIALASIYIGAQYGRASSTQVVASLDWRRPLQASLSMAVGVLLMAMLAAPLTALAFSFGSAEYFSLMALGLVACAVFSSGSLIKSMAMVVLGLLLGQVNTDVITGTPRYSFNLPELRDGLDFIVMAIGVFGVGDMLARLGRLTAGPGRDLPIANVEAQDGWRNRVRGTVLGLVLGALPAGESLSIHAAGASDRGRAADPVSAGSASASLGLLPMLTLGLPSNAAVALLIGALTLRDAAPGPQWLVGRPELTWGLIGSLWIACIWLALLKYPLRRLRGLLQRVPYRLIYPAAALAACLSVFALNGSPFNILLTCGFGLLGYIFSKLGCAPAPMLLGFVLHPLMEENLRRAVLLAAGDWGTFLARPVSAGLLLASALLLASVALPKVRALRASAFTRD